MKEKKYTVGYDKYGNKITNIDIRKNLMNKDKESIKTKAKILKNLKNIVSSEIKNRKIIKNGNITLHIKQEIENEKKSFFFR